MALKEAMPVDEVVIFGDYAPVSLIAKRAGKHPTTIKRYIKLGLLDGKKIGERWYGRVAAVRKLTDD